MLSQQYQDPTLSIIAHGASNLKDVEVRTLFVTSFTTCSAQHPIEFIPEFGRENCSQLRINNASSNH